MGGEMWLGTREPLEEACECGDMYKPCACDRNDRVWREHGEMRDVLEALVSPPPGGFAHDAPELVAARRLLAGVYRG